MVHFHERYPGIRWYLRSLTRTYRKGITITAALLVLTSVTAAVILTQVVSVNPSAATPDVVFATGDDYTSINSLGYATLTLGSSATDATLALSGVPGASDLQLTNLLDITNQDASDAYSVTLSRSASLDADITNFTVTVKNASDTTVETWYAKDAASATAFTLPASTTYTIDVRFLIADGVAAGSLDSFDLKFDLSEV